MTMTMDFGRLITAMVTPFKEDGSVNYDMALLIANYLIENGTDTILLAGTTGESPTLTHDEEFELFRVIIEGVKGRAKVMAGTGSNCTRTAVNSTQEAEAIGVDGVLQVVPYYNKPSQEGLYRHFSTVADQTSIPILLYNVPGRTSCNMEPETMARLAEVDGIIGVKEAAGSVEQVRAIRQATPESFLIYSGDDGLLLPFMEEGAVGLVSVASHIAGAQIKSMIDLFVSGDKDAAKAIETRLAPLIDTLFMTTNPVPVKAAMGLIGFPSGGPRLPLVDLTSDECKQLETVVDQFLGT